VQPIFAYSLFSIRETSFQPAYFAGFVKPVYLRSAYSATLDGARLSRDCCFHVNQQAAMLN
jgi:hypothetical protein